MAALKNALPGHLKSALGGSSGEAEFAKKHHGKTQSHMVSGVFFVYQKHDVGNDSTISEWLINYSGGFTKRGLVGQLSIYLSYFVTVTYLFGTKFGNMVALSHTFVQLLVNWNS